jgi:hypothetical protein
MARFVKIDNRIINLDQVKYFERKDEGGELVVNVVMEPFITTWTTASISDWQQPGGTEGPPRRGREVQPLNMAFTGADAKVVWEKLCETAEVWGLPNEMPK